MIAVQRLGARKRQGKALSARSDGLLAWPVFEDCFTSKQVAGSVNAPHDPCPRGRGKDDLAQPRIRIVTLSVRMPSLPRELFVAVTDALTQTHSPHRGGVRFAASVCFPGPGVGSLSWRVMAAADSSGIFCRVSDGSCLVNWQVVED